MRAIIFFLVASILSFDAYPFWIWSPKTKQWKNPKYSAQVTPYLQYRQGLKYFEDKNYKIALREFRKLLVSYPDSYEAAEAQYYLGRCEEEMEHPYQAFQEYAKVIESYPNSQRIGEVIERQYNIASYFLERESKKWLGVSKYDFIEHPAIEIFKQIVDKAPYSEYAPVAQYKLGVLLLGLGRYDDARDVFQKVMDNYPDNEWALPAKYQLAIAVSKASPGIGYDSSALEEATRRLDEFIKKHPEAQVVSSATNKLKELRNKEAKKNFDIAQFYEKQRKYEAAIVYYQLVKDSYSGSDYAREAEEKIKELEGK